MGAEGRGEAPKRTAADRWLGARMNPRHREALNRSEQDLLGTALEFEMRGEYRLAQEWLDALASEHRARMMEQGKGE